MIKKLRIEFIAVMMGVLFAVFAILFVVLNVFMQTGSRSQTEQLLQYVAQQDGLAFPFHGTGNGNRNEAPRGLSPDLNPQMMRAGRFFYVKSDAQGNIIEINSEMMFDFTESDALSLAKDALNRYQTNGVIDNYQYLVSPKAYGNIIVFAERSIEERILSRLVTISSWVALGTFAALFVFSLLLSKWVVKPIADAFDKQRRFISDAGHELKTPLTILNANADVLANEVGQNGRIENIKLQSERMNHLIQSLLTLAKADEGNAQVVFNEFDLSKTILNTALEFECRAFEEGKRYETAIDEHISYTGDQRQIRQLASILTDNALKYSNENGQVKISLFILDEAKRGLCNVKAENGKRVFSVYNTGEGIAEKERPKVFERFYRSDDSRARESGGYGLGLSIAKAIADAHKARIAVDGKAGEWVRFTVVM
ncbi:MAG: HAMP domain-containing histidine kinase [Oscillospiraceae bacterium]|jgi:signal transduction histidine kinase|nr:HAMP domain-containing histidine kinase [Oscillospiraceae bacterium]